MPPLPPKSRMKVREGQNAPFGGRGGLNVPFNLSKIVASTFYQMLFFLFLKPAIISFFAMDIYMRDFGSVLQGLCLITCVGLHVILE